MDEYESLSHTRWNWKYQVVFIPKCRRKALYGELRRHLGEVFKKLAAQKESRIEEGHLMPDHVHMMIAIPPKYAVSQVVGYIKGKSAIHLARVYAERKRNSVGAARRFGRGDISRLDRRFETRTVMPKSMKTAAPQPSGRNRRCASDSELHDQAWRGDDDLRGRFRRATRNPGPRQATPVDNRYERLAILTPPAWRNLTRRGPLLDNIAH